MNKKKRNMNLMVNKIRNLLKKNNYANYEELKKTCGNLSRSVIVTYYRVYKELYHTSGHLNKQGTNRKKQKNTLRSRVTEYFERHPEHTITEAAKALQLSWTQTYNTIYGLKAAGKKIAYRKRRKQELERGKAKQIRDYVKSHPKASVKECAQATGSSNSYVCIITYMARKHGKLPNKRSRS